MWARWDEGLHLAFRLQLPIFVPLSVEVTTQLMHLDLATAYSFLTLLVLTPKLL